MKILMLHRDPAAREAVGDFARGKGIDFQETFCAEDALRAALAGPPSLAVLDARMPLSEGYALVKGFCDYETLKPVKLFFCYDCEAAATEGREELLKKLEAALEGVSSGSTAAAMPGAGNGVLLREEELRESEERLRALIDGTPDIICFKDGEGRWLEANRADLELFHLENVPYRGKKDSELADYSPLHHDAFLTCEASDEAAWSKGVVSSGEETVPRYDGTVSVYDVIKSPLFYPDGRRKGLVVLGRDITARKKAEDEIRALNAGLEQRVAERTAELAAGNEEWAAFAYSVSHDLKGPLNRIEGFVSILEEDLSPALDEKSRGYLGRIRFAVKNLHALIEGLLALSRSGRAPLSFSSFPLGEVVQEAIAEVSAGEAGREIEWRVGELPVVEGDRAMLKQALTNLLGNAAKYTRRLKKARVEVSAETSERGYTVSVRDNGLGFDMKDSGRLFGAFQRLNPPGEFEGSGIGLNTVRRIVLRHGGTVRAEGKPGKGAVFSFFLPAHPAVQ
ncbi:MAG TPA: hypothetical protein DDW67_05615 [Elusimicrobia bacterium]|nr:hypothetical protein [Elusimicrobiota bacterium]